MDRGDIVDYLLNYYNISVMKKKKNKEITGYYGYWDSKKKKRIFKKLWHFFRNRAIFGKKQTVN